MAATANKIATRTYCNTLKANAFSTDLSKCVTAKNCSNAGFSHNSTTPSYKCVKETNVSVMTSTFEAADLTPWMSSFYDIETRNNDLDAKRAFSIGSVLMLDNVTNKFKLFAFSSISRLYTTTYTNGAIFPEFKQYDVSRFTPIGIVVGVPASEYAYINEHIYSTAIGNNQVPCLTLMSLLAHDCTIGLSNMWTKNAETYSQWMVTNFNVSNYGNPLDIYNPITTCDGSGTVEFAYITRAIKQSIFPIQLEASYTDKPGYGTIIPSISYMLGGILGRNLSSSATNYMDLMNNTTNRPIPTSWSSSLLNKSGISRLVPNSKYHMSSATVNTDTSEATKNMNRTDAGRIVDFYTTNSSRDIVGSLSYSSLYPLPINSNVPTLVMLSPYTTTKHNTIQEAMGGGTNYGVIFKSDDFLNYNQYTYNALYDNNIDPNISTGYEVCCLPTGASYEVCLLNSHLSFWRTTALYKLLDDTGVKFDLYTPSLYELFKLSARSNFIFQQLNALNKSYPILSKNKNTYYSNVGIGASGNMSFASCELDDNLLYYASTDWNSLITSGYYNTNSCIVGNQTVANSVASAYIKKHGRLCVEIPGAHTAQAEPHSITTLQGGGLFSGPMFWSNTGFNSLMHYSCPILAPFIRIPVGLLSYWIDKFNTDYNI